MVVVGFDFVERIDFVGCVALKDGQAENCLLWLNWTWKLKNVVVK